MPTILLKKLGMVRFSVFYADEKYSKNWNSVKYITI